MKCVLCDHPDLARHGPIAGRDASIIQCKACGTYEIDTLTIGTINRLYRQKRHLLSAATRRSSDAMKPAFLSDDSLESLAASVPPRGTLFDMVDRVLVLAAERTHEYWEPTRIDGQADWPLVVARGEREFTYLLNLAIERKYIDPIGLVITSTGWERIEFLRSSQPQSPQAFVAMWFDATLEDPWLLGFKPGIEDTGRFRAIRVSDVPHNGKIDDRIVAEIRRSGLVVADFTGHRGGVYFEAGLALGLGIPVIWTCHKDALSDTHFDTRQYNHVVWSDPAELRMLLKNRIEATITLSPNTKAF